MNKMLIIVMAIVIIAGGAYFMLVLNGDNGPALLPYSPGEYFVTNINSSNRLLKASVVLELNDAKLAESFTGNNYLIRDAIIFILRGLTEEQVRQIGVEDQLREQIRIALNEKMETEGIVNVYFNDFVMQ